MKAIINGIEVSGTPEEIFRYKQLETRAEAETFFDLQTRYILKPGPGVTEMIDDMLKNTKWSVK